MSITVLIMGALPRAPEAKTSKKGAAYAAASVRVAVGTEIEFWSALAFDDDAREALLLCTEGEKVALQGSPKFDVGANPQGEVKVRRTLFVEAVLTVRPKPRTRKPKAVTAAPAPLLSRAEGELNDALPF